MPLLKHPDEKAKTFIEYRYMTRPSLTLLALPALLWFAGPAQGSERLSDQVAPRAQSVTLTLDSGAQGYNGEVEIDLDVLSTVPNIRLHAAEMNITSATLKRRFLAKDLAVSEGEAEQIILDLGKPIEAGHYTLRLSFDNDYPHSPYGLYQVKVDDVGYLFSQFEADDARQAFPCFDEPSFKIPFTMTLRVPKGHKAVTNAPELSRKDEGQWTRIQFKPLQPTPSYALAIATGPLDVYPVEGFNFPSNIYAVQGREGMETVAQEIIPPLLPYLEDYFGSSYPFDKLDLIAVPNFWPGAMENPGAITFKESILLQDPAAVTNNAKARLAYISAHELAHMWFGDLVTLAWWDDFWLNESFATWMGRKTIISVYPELGGAVHQLEEGLEIMDRDSSATVRPIRLPVDPSAVFESTNFMAYPKGQAVLTMFEQYLGEPVFQQGVQRYIDENKWGNATSEDLWRALESVSGEAISPAMTPYLDQPGLPLIRLELDGHTLKAEQSRFLIGQGEVEAGEPWHIPIVLRVKQGGEVTTQSVFLTEATGTFTLSGEEDIEWIFPAAQGRGYYRWALTPVETKRLVEGSAEGLSYLERIALLSNLSALSKAGEIDVGLLLELLSTFVLDPDPSVAINALGFMGEFAGDDILPEDLRPAYALYLRQSLTPALETIGFMPREGESQEVKNLRAALYGRLGKKGEHEGVKEQAKAIAEAFLADPSSVERTLARAGLGVYASEGDAALRERLVEKTLAAQDGGLRRIYLEALAALPTSELQLENVQLAFNDDLNTDASSILLRGVGRHDPALLQQVLMDNLDRVLERIEPAYAAWLPTMGVNCSQERLEKAQNFYTQEANQRRGMERGLKEAEAGVKTCKIMQDLYGPGLRDYLEALVAMSQSDDQEGDDLE